MSRLTSYLNQHTKQSIPLARAQGKSYYAYKHFRILQALTLLGEPDEPTNHS